MLSQPERTQSLRLRLFVRIVVPLVLVAGAISTWRTFDTIETAKEIFDRNLTAISIAVARDVASSGGELLSPETFDLLEEASSGKVFYHVLGPGGVYVSGFGHPPAGSAQAAGDSQIPVLFDSTHSGDPIRAASLTQYVDSAGLQGFAKITVWQKQAVRNQFALRQAILSLSIVGLLVLAVMAFIWIGVNSGLAPLINLKTAISKRGPTDLRPISRTVPEEVKPLVGTLNALFGEVQSSIEGRDRFIANAAHQIRNPISAVSALAESAMNAKSPEEARRRIKKTVEEAKHTAHLAEQLLMLEKLSLSSSLGSFVPVDLSETVAQVTARMADRALDMDVDFCFDPPAQAAKVEGDAVLIAEAIENLVDNALTHGGKALTKLNISISVRSANAILVVEDNGRGIPESEHELVFERFSQLDFGRGSGLGLAIVKEIVLAHGGNIELSTGSQGCGARFEIKLPIVVEGDHRKNQPMMRHP